MIAFLIKIFILLVVVSCSNQNDIKEINGRIEYVENNLIEFVSPAGMLNPDSSQLANPKTLHDRMAHYNTPGVSIAIINNYELEWAKGYGVLEKGLDEPAEVKAATKTYRSEMDILEDFIATKCFISDGERTAHKDLYVAYQGWCEENEETPVKTRTFAKKLEGRGLAYKKPGNIKTWQDIGLK